MERYQGYGQRLSSWMSSWLWPTLLLCEWFVTDRTMLALLSSAICSLFSNFWFQSLLCRVDLCLAFSPPADIMSWSQARSQAESGWQQQPVQTQAYHFHLVPDIDALADAVERGARDQQIDALINELATRFQKAEQLLYTLGNATEKDVATQKRTVDDHRIKLEERRAVLAKYKVMVEKIYPTDN